MTLMTDVPVISADCAMADDLSISARVIVWVVCIPMLSPFLDLFGPCGLMDLYHW
jgi:hypothetical protein